MRTVAFSALLMLASSVRGDFVPDWNKALPPYRIADNLYYVGTNYLASFLLTTKQGNILINPDFAESVPLIRASIERLGFKYSDIKIILISHAHDDHAAGTAVMKQQTGAKLMVMDGDVPVMEAGGAGSFQYTQHWTPVKVDRVLHDGDTVSLGGVTLRAYLTPGHTKGCTTWTTAVQDHGRTLRVVIVGSPNVNPGYRLVGNKQYPGIAADYEKTFRVLSSLPCDIFLGAHGEYYNMDEKLKKMQAGDADAFVDPKGYREYVAEREQAFLKELHTQQRGLANGGQQ